MNVTTIAKELLEEIQEHLGTGKKQAAVKAISNKIIVLLEAANEPDDETIIQVDLDCGELKAVWVNRPNLAEARVVVVENPAIGDEDGDGVYIDDDRVIISVSPPEMMSNTAAVFAAIDSFE